MLPVALVYPFLIAPLVFSLCCQFKNGKTRATGNIETKPKGQLKMDKPEQLAT
jgi:hypothetical protein